MRIYVHFPAGACPEVQADLARCPPRARAERLRLLATVGLVTLRGGGPGAAATAPPVEPPASDADAAGRRQLLARLVTSLDPDLQV